MHHKHAYLWQVGGKLACTRTAVLVVYGACLLSYVMAVLKFLEYHVHCFTHPQHECGSHHPCDGTPVYSDAMSLSPLPIGSFPAPSIFFSSFYRPIQFHLPNITWITETLAYLLTYYYPPASYHLMDFYLYSASHLYLQFPCQMHVTELLTVSTGIIRLLII